MSSTLIDSVKSVFTDNLVTKFSTLLGETESNTRKALQAAIPAVLTTALYRAGNSEEANKLYNQSKKAAGNDFYGHVHELSASTGGLAAGSALLTKGSDYTGSLLEGRADNVIKEITRYVGISVSSSSFITGVACFASLDAIGRQIANANLDVKGMIEWLATQRDSIINTIPSGLQVKQALGLSHYPGEKLAKRRNNTALIVILIILVLAVAAFFYFKSKNDTGMPAPANTSDTTQTNTTPAPTTSGIVNDSLPNGQVLSVSAGSTENKLINFLNDPNAKIDQKDGNWFDFTAVSFDNNSANLLLQSETQLKNIVAILNAYPKAKVKIGGFTDNVGDSVANVKLSQQRADNVLAKLKDLGTKHSQLDGAKGYGPAYPIGDNGTEAGRAVNRRMSLGVIEK